MLVLTRRVGEILVIDGKIEVKVLNIQGSQVRLGVNAEGMTIDRLEIHERKTRNKQRVEGGGNSA